MNTYITVLRLTCNSPRIALKLTVDAQKIVNTE